MIARERLAAALARAQGVTRGAEVVLCAFDAGAASAAEVEIAEARAWRAWEDYYCLRDRLTVSAPMVDSTGRSGL